MQPLVTNTTTSYTTVCRLLDEGQLDEAGTLFGNLNFQELPREEELAARVEAIQLAILMERYSDALEHAEAALLIAEHEPLIHHLAGKALWKQGDQRTAAESFVYAAELLEGLHEEKPPAQYNADPSQVYFMAAEACRAFMQHAEAMDYYQRAQMCALQ
jgi:tetratricopeptide (TPR) repeat protein